MPILECLHLPLLIQPPPAPGQPGQIAPPHVSLVAHGPTILAQIGFDPAFFGAIASPAPPALTLPTPSAAVDDAQQQGAPPPLPPVAPVLALIDTGASNSCIDDTLAIQLNLPLINRVRVGGVHGGELLCVYLGKLSIPQLGFSRAGQFIGAKMEQGNQAHRALIGRDLLANMLMVYDGTTGRVKLSV
jgi:hypothetical protein